MNSLPLLRTLAGLLLASLLFSLTIGIACSPQTGTGESHFGTTKAFLRVCEDGICELGDSCACAVCTVPCNDLSDCAARIFGPGSSEELPANVLCQAPLCQEQSSADESDAGGSVCNVICDTDEDCSFLKKGHKGGPHVCRSGSCRTENAPDLPTEQASPGKACASGKTLVPGVSAPDGLALCLDETEVTVASYRACVEAGSCAAPDAGNYLTAGRDEHPVNFVDLDAASAFCEFVGDRLPTLPEWQAASESATYPWGADVPLASDMPPRVCALGTGDTCPVRGFSDGNGPYGHTDLSGNVAEIVLSDPTPCSAGGAYDDAADSLTSASCPSPVVSNATTGFRCLTDL